MGMFALGVTDHNNHQERNNRETRRDIKEGMREMRIQKLTLTSLLSVLWEVVIRRWSSRSADVKFDAPPRLPRDAACGNVAALKFSREPPEYLLHVGGDVYTFKQAGHLGYPQRITADDAMRAVELWATGPRTRKDVVLMYSVHLLTPDVCWPCIPWMRSRYCFHQKGLRERCRAGGVPLKRWTCAARRSKQARAGADHDKRCGSHTAGTTSGHQSRRRLRWADASCASSVEGSPGSHTPRGGICGPI